MVGQTIILAMALFQVALIRKLDMLIAMRTAPGNSFVNPVERIMSILNLGLQGVALEKRSVRRSSRHVTQSVTYEQLQKRIQG